MDYQVLPLVFQGGYQGNLNFQNFFSSNECGEYIMGGRMQFYQHNNSNGLLFTTANHRSDRPDNKSQSESSIFGKVLFIDFEKKNGLLHL